MIHAKLLQGSILTAQNAMVLSKKAILLITGPGVKRSCVLPVGNPNTGSFFPWLLMKMYIMDLGTLIDSDMKKIILKAKMGSAAKVIITPFRFWLNHDHGLSKMVVYSTDERTARNLIMQAEGCPDSAIKRRRA